MLDFYRDFHRLEICHELFDKLLSPCALPLRDVRNCRSLSFPFVAIILHSISKIVMWSNRFPSPSNLVKVEHLYVSGKIFVQTLLTKGWRYFALADYLSLCAINVVISATHASIVTFNLSNKESWIVTMFKIRFGWPGFIEYFGHSTWLGLIQVGIVSLNWFWDQVVVSVGTRVSVVFWPSLELCGWLGSVIWDCFVVEG